jgi:hypothetical protein
MKFTWWTKDGKKHEKVVDSYDERLHFIEWLETSPEVKRWR